MTTRCYGPKQSGAFDDPTPYCKDGTAAPETCDGCPERIVTHDAVWGERTATGYDEGDSWREDYDE